MPEFKDITGMRFGRWTVIERRPNYIAKSGNVYTRWLCQCDCGTIREVNANSLLNNKSTSCGCYHREKSKAIASKLFTTHHETKTKLYGIWAGMIKRCNNPHASNFSDYGGRGIAVCDEWLIYENFRDWAVNNGYRDDLTIDRIDNNDDYCPYNCRWTTMMQQQNNRRSNVFIECRGERHTIAEWSRIIGINYNKLWELFRKKCVPMEEILNQYA